MDKKNLFQKIEAFFTKKEPFAAGMYTYQSPGDAEEQYRLHLRIEKDGTGILVINAATVLHLNQSAVEYAYHIIHQTDFDSVVSQVSTRYQAEKSQIQSDFADFKDKITTLIHTPDLDPVTYLDIERQEPYSAEISAPYRLDCALTYQVGEASSSEHAPLDRVDRELTTEEWLSVIKTAARTGIPHILFTGGEPTLRTDLPELITQAEELGLVTGLLTDGLKLGDDDYFNTLLRNGLDHLMIVFDPANQEMWGVLQKIFDEDIFTTVHLTLRKDEELGSHIQRLASMGANALSLSAVDQELAEQLQDARSLAAVNQLDLVWDLPVPYSCNNPVMLELKEEDTAETPDGAGKAWLYVEPDGDVLPAQGLYTQIMGNITKDSWEDIWKAA